MRATRDRPFAFLVTLLLGCATLLAVPGSVNASAGADASRAGAVSKKPRLTATAPTPVAAGATARSRVVLLNRTRKDLAKVTITATVSGSAKVTPRVKRVKLVRRGAKKTFGVKVVAGKERVATVRLRAKVKGKVVAATRFRVRTEDGTTTPATSLVGRYFFYKGTTTSAGDKELYFGAGFANADVPDEAYAPCSAATEDCLPYTYDAKTGALTVGSEPGEVPAVGGSLTLGGLHYQEAALQQPGARFAVSLTSSYVGYGCPLAGCFSFLSDLTLAADGSYSETVINNFATSATYEGTYEVISESRVRLRYVDDEGVAGERVKTIGVVLDEAGQPDPAGGGLVLAGAWYFLSD